MTDKPTLATIRLNEQGRIEVSTRALATLVADAVVHSYGVVGMAPRNLRDSVAHVLRPEDQYKGIDVSVADDGITIDLFVVIEYGTRIVTVARNIMDSVHYTMNHALGEVATQINVHVQGLRMESSTKPKDEVLSRWRRFGTIGGLRGQRSDESN